MRLVDVCRKIAQIEDVPSPAECRVKFAPKIVLSDHGIYSGRAATATRRTRWSAERREGKCIRGQQRILGPTTSAVPSFVRTRRPCIDEKKRGRCSVALSDGAKTVSAEALKASCFGHQTWERMQLQELLITVWERKVVVGLVLICCLLGAAAYTVSDVDGKYKATATIAFLPNPHEGQYLPSEDLSALVSTYAAIAQSDRNLAAAGAIVGHPLTGSVSASTMDSGGWVLRISGAGADSQSATEAAQATTHALVKTIGEEGIFTPTVIAPAVAPKTPAQSRPLRLIMPLAAVLGLVAGVLLALFLDSMYIRDITSNQAKHLDDVSARSGDVSEDPNTFGSQPSSG